jgi:hypothetical protein
MQIFVRGADELIPLELEKDDTVQDIRVCNYSIPSIELNRFFSSFFVGICR